MSYLIITVVADEEISVGALISTKIASIRELGHICSIFVYVSLCFGLNTSLARQHQLFISSLNDYLEGVEAERCYFTQWAAVGHFSPFLDALKAEIVLTIIHSCSILGLF